MCFYSRRTFDLKKEKQVYIYILISFEIKFSTGINMSPIMRIFCDITKIL